ncbi:hypothetical protein NDU88_001258 [Pleurodeles waltl]|uniref:Uncharacterized protein n=1 Tax=Pleurodeles waltl TaxID=8319 RepID=A0AAV7WLE4_PLEWA|nr:hypothetical protein NDU88_001258 [Pleurodeles waltl]
MGYPPVNQSATLPVSGAAQLGKHRDENLLLYLGLQMEAPALRHDDLWVFAGPPTSLQGLLTWSTLCGILKCLTVFARGLRAQEKG